MHKSKQFRSFSFLFVLVTVLGVSTSSFSAPTVKNRIGKIYSKDPIPGFPEGSHLFETRSSLEQDKESYHLTSRTLEVGGRTLYEEEVRWEGENKLKEYSVQNHELKTSAKVSITQDQIQYEYTEEGKTKKDSESLPKETLVIGPYLNRFVELSLQKLIQGNTIKVQLIVPNRMETIGFEFQQVPFEEGEAKTDSLVKVRFKISSVLLAALVKPMHFFLDQKTGKLVRYEGTLGVNKPGTRDSMVGSVIYE